MSDYDVIVVGGGVIGASVAHHLLARSPALRVLMLERETEVGTGATSKATGGVRHQFSTEANIRLTLLSYPYFAESEARLGRSVDFVRHGYLFVTTSPASPSTSLSRTPRTRPIFSSGRTTTRDLRLAAPRSSVRRRCPGRPARKPRP
jgi:glycine/D-amino acid oxidase-like deaminating enzyme